MDKIQSIGISILIIIGLYLIVSLIFPMVPNECCRNTTITNSGITCLCMYHEQNIAIPIPILKYIFPIITGCAYYRFNNRKTTFREYAVVVFAGYFGIVIVYILMPFFIRLFTHVN